MRGWVDPEKRPKPSTAVVEGSVIASVAPRAHDEDGLNERQRLFVDAYCAGIPASIAGTDEDVPPGDGYHAALYAGYADSGASNMATRNLLKPAIQAEIERRVKAGRGSMLLAARGAVMKVLEKGQDERAVVAAAVAAMDRFGLPAPKGPLIDARTVNVVAPQEASAVLRLVAERAAARAQELEGP